MNEKMQTLTAKLKETVELSPHKIAAQIKKNNDYVQYTYQALYQAVESIAVFLKRFGIKEGDKIAIILENRPEWGFVYFGIFNSTPSTSQHLILAIDL